VNNEELLDERSRAEDQIKRVGGVENITEENMLRCNTAATSIRRTCIGTVFTMQRAAWPASVSFAAAGGAVQRL
jgi:hypothetical protein